MSNKLKR